MTTTTQMGVDDSASSFLTEDDAADKFLSRWSETDPNVDTSASEATEDEDAGTRTDEANAGEADAGQAEAEGTQADLDNEGNAETNQEAESTESTEKPTGKQAADDDTATITVDGEELQVSVKDLKRLYGQEAALTKKSQQVAEKRKEVDTANQRAAAQLDRLHKKASDRWEPYSKIDMLVASTQLPAEQFAALRAEAQAAYDDFRFITQEVDGFVQESNSQREKHIKETAQQSVKYLAEKIPGWNQEVYDNVRAYAESVGMPAQIVNGIVDPYALEMIHKAMQFDKAKAVVTTRVNKTPTKVLTTSKVANPKDTKVDATAKAKQRLRTSGTTDDAAEMFLARWSK